MTVVDCTFINNSVIPSTGGFSQPGGSPGTGGSAFGTDFFLMSGGALNFDLTGPLILNNPIEGDQGAGGGDTLSGGLTKSGSGRLELFGVNTYTGITTVQAGELHIDTSVVTDIVVQSGGTLGSTFTILPNTAATNAGSLTNSGRVDPGLGTITISGDFTNNSSGTLAVEITSSGSNGSLFLPTGNSLLSGGILEVFCNSGTYIDGTHYTVINSPVTGTFAELLQIGPMGDRLIIDVAYSSVVLTIRNNPIFNNLVVTSKIAREVAGCIESALPTAPGSDFALMIQTIGRLEPGQINRALIDLSPVNYGALEWINERNNNYLADILSEHFFEPSCTERNYCTDNLSAWVDVFGNLMNNFKRYNNLVPFEANALGAVAGLDYSSSPDFTMGGALAYTHTWLDWKHHHGNGNIDSYYGALYACFRRTVNVDVSAIGGGSDHELKRKIDIHGTDAVTGAPIDIDRVARSNPWGYFFNGRLRFSADREWRRITFEPFGLIDYNYFNRKGFKEHGANSLDLKVRDHTQNMLRSEAGLKAYRTWDWEWNCSCIEPYLGLSWVGEFPLGKSRQRASFSGQSCVIDVTSYHSSSQLVSPQAGVKWMTSDGFSLVFGYKGLYNRKTSINEVEGRLEWVF